MQKELVMFIAFAAIAIGALVFQSQGDSSTGAVVNGIAQVRLDRIKLAQTHFTGRGLNSECKTQINRIQELVRINADERFYHYTGLVDQERFFLNEQELFSLLIKLGNFGSFDYKVYFPEKPYGQSCPVEISQQAQEKFTKIAEIDLAIIQKTIERSPCPDRRKAIAARDEALISYRSANYARFFEKLQESAKEALC